MSTDATEFGSTSQLREYLGILRLRKWWIIVTVVLAVASAIVLTLHQTPLYASHSKVLVEAIDLTSGQAGTQVAPNIGTEEQLVSSIVVAELVARRLKLSESPDELVKALSVAAPADTEVIEITYTDPSPREARRRAQAFAEAYLELRRARYLNALKATSAPLEQRIAALNAELAQVNRAIGTTKNASKRATLQDQANSLVSQIAIVDQRLADLSPDSALPVGQIEDPADLPLSPTNHKLALNVALALFLGLAAGIGIALVRNRLDDHLRADTEFETIAGASLLARIPVIKGVKSNRGGVLPPMSSTSEGMDGFRSLRAAILYAISRHGTRTLLVTSPLAGDGKSTVTAYLGMALAHAEKRVLLVCGDLRRPRLHQLFGATQQVGLTDVLAGKVRPGDALLHIGPQGLFLMPTGPIVENQVELLGSDHMARILDELADGVDLVIIDAPPILDVPDSQAMARFVDGVLLVLDGAATTKSQVIRALRELDVVHATVLGGVLNKFVPSRFRSYYGAPAYDYKLGVDLEDGRDRATRPTRI
jgi:capsular exopolysaccharide synthesis family protein